jgi:hypothetical protein
MDTSIEKGCNRHKRAPIRDDIHPIGNYSEFPDSSGNSGFLLSPGRIRRTGRKIVVRYEKRLLFFMI